MRREYLSATLWICSIIGPHMAMAAPDPDHLCPNHATPATVESPSKRERLLFERIQAAARLHTPVAFAAVSGYCFTPAAIFVSRDWLTQDDLTLPDERTPAVALVAWLLAEHHAGFGLHAPEEAGPVASKDPEFLAGCALARMGLRGLPLAEQVEALVARTTPSRGDPNQTDARRRDAIATGVAACR